jgi:hypothetical protein
MDERELAIWRQFWPEEMAEHERRLERARAVGPRFEAVVLLACTVLGGVAVRPSAPDPSIDEAARRRGLERDRITGQWHPRADVERWEEQREKGGDESQRWTSRPPRRAA